LTNERPETEHTNELRLLELHHPVGVAVLPDMTGGFHSISDPVRPIRCNDYTGRDALEQILEDDNLFWESDLPSKDLAKEDNLRDGLMMEFPKPLGAKVAKFVVRGMNTALGSFALQQLFSLKGVNRLDWYRRLEENTGESLRLLGFMKREGMLHVKVKRDNEWVEQAAFFDPGPVVSKEQLVVLDVSEISGDRIHIALECATDLWRIDQVFADYSTDIPVYPEELPLVSALDESGRDVGDLLKRDDDKYYTTIQGEIAQLAFAVPPSQPGSQSTFVLKTKGFYHEWFTQSGKDQTALLEKILEDPLLGAKLYMAKWREVKPEYQ
jgi:hypothetical protein